MKRNPRPRKHVPAFAIGSRVTLASYTGNKSAVGTVTAAKAKTFTVAKHEPIKDDLYRVEINNAFGAFGNATRFVFESQIVSANAGKLVAA